MESRTGPFSNPGVSSMAFLPFVTAFSGEREDTVESFLDKHSTNTATSSHLDFIRSILKNPHEGLASFFSYPAQANFEVGGEADVRKITLALLPGHYIQIGPPLSHPLSRGTTHLQSTDAKQNPIN